MIVVFITGPLLAWLTGYWQSPWLQLKFVLVLGLGALHGYFTKNVKIFALDENCLARPASFASSTRSLPFSMILIVILVVVKPF